MRWLDAGDGVRADRTLLSPRPLRREVNSRGIHCCGADRFGGDCFGGELPFASLSARIARDWAVSEKPNNTISQHTCCPERARYALLPPTEVYVEEDGCEFAHEHSAKKPRARVSRERGGARYVARFVQYGSCRRPPTQQKSTIRWRLSPPSLSAVPTDTHTHARENRL